MDSSAFFIYPIISFLTNVLIASAPIPTPIQPAISEAKSEASAKPKNESSLPLYKQATLRIEAVSMTVGFSVDASSLEIETRDWLKQSGLTLLNSSEANSKNYYNLCVKVYVQRTDNSIYWHAITTECQPVRALSSQQGNPANLTNEPDKSKNSFHLMAQKGEVEFNKNLVATIRRSLLELLGNAISPIKQPDSRWLRGMLRNTQSLPDPSSVNYIFEVLKIKTQPSPPSYPKLAKEHGIQGTVEVALLVNSKGTPILAEALSGPNELLEPALDYALKLEFEPATLNGNPRDANFKLTMPFKLK